MAHILMVTMVRLFSRQWRNNMYITIPGVCNITYDEHEYGLLQVTEMSDSLQQL